MKTKNCYYCLFILVIFAGCSLINSDHHDDTARTYPQAFDFRSTTVEKLRNKEINPPDSVNVQAYVAEVNVCPENANCVVPNGIYIADSSDSTSQKFYLMVYKARQFEQGACYSISLKVTSRSEDSDIIDIKLLGYGMITRYDDL